MKHISFIFSCFVLMLGVAQLGIPAARAGACYSDPVYMHDWTGTMNIAAFGRDQACMDGSKVLTTIPKGTSVHIMGETDGWYRVEWNGYRLWVGATLITVTAKRFSGDSVPYDLYMSKFSNTITTPDTTVQQDESNAVSSPAVSDPIMLAKVKGYILLQVQSHGEAWYADPITEKRYYMKDGPTAYQMMRSFGLGVTESDYQKISTGDLSLKKRLSGRIVLRAQAHGEAYYIHPGDLSVYYLQNGDEAYRVMRLYSLGITNADLNLIATAELQVK